MTNVITLATIASLQTYPGTEPTIWIDGYSSAADGGEGMFVYVAGSSLTDNAGTVIVSTVTSRVYVREYNNQPLNVCWFGAQINSPTVDSSTALLKALAALPAAGGAIYFPPGLFTFNAAISYTLPGTFPPPYTTPPPVFALHFVGSGQDATILNWPVTKAGTCGITLNADSPGHTVHFRDMSLTTGYSCSTTAITVNQAAPYVGSQYNFQNDFLRLSFYGYPFTTAAATPPTTYWGTGIYINGLSNIAYDTLFFVMGNGSGVAISINGGSEGNSFSVVHNLSKITTWDGSVAVNFGAYVQGVTVTQCNFTDCNNGIVIPSGQGGCAQLTVTASQFACGSYCIDIDSTLIDLFVQGNLFYFHDGTIAGINISQANNAVVLGAAIIGNSFGGNTTYPGGTGIITGPSDSEPVVTFGTVSGNQFSQLTTGVNLTGGTSNWYVQGNSYNAVTTQVVPGTGNHVATLTN